MHDLLRTWLPRFAIRHTLVVAEATGERTRCSAGSPRPSRRMPWIYATEGAFASCGSALESDGAVGDGTAGAGEFDGLSGRRRTRRRPPGVDQPGAVLIVAAGPQGGRRSRRADAVPRDSGSRRRRARAPACAHGGRASGWTELTLNLAAQGLTSGASVRLSASSCTVGGTAATVWGCPGQGAQSGEGSWPSRWTKRVHTVGCMLGVGQPPGSMSTTTVSPSKVICLRRPNGSRRRKPLSGAGPRGADTRRTRTPLPHIWRCCRRHCGNP